MPKPGLGMTVEFNFYSYSFLTLLWCFDRTCLTEPRYLQYL